ncbi:transcriptional regulator, AraC family [Fontibacillus panacisegetis]|uniref:Transcriptional regulator, AraC family n=1 Tax=Fontibacillus panacisegetis TaxID=670482 RepID=A0A1G7E2S3_9BACL|nr:AraC family transcriptional regulator [Fontibacillus panacisegetis]SDE57919.1 transcriptional regulator, AraC family [Fontibacillus panacisegetis]
MDYLASLEKAIEYIEQNLDEELFSEDIAKAAGYSLYHLTHIFTAVIGEPIGSYIQKRRLSNSCKKLLYSNKRIIDIAIESGFGSSEAFSRAFKSVYGVSPVVYRKNNSDLYIGSKMMIDREALLHLAEGITIKPRIVEIDKIFVAGIRGETSILHNILPDLWNRLFEIRNQIPTSYEARRFGICETDRTKTNISKDGNVTFSETVGIEVDNFQCLPRNVNTKIIPGGRYAVFTHKGTVATLIKTYDYLWGSWVLFTKETLDEREDFEIYDKRFLGADNVDSQIDIYIPIK